MAARNPLHYRNVTGPHPKPGLGLWLLAAMVLWSALGLPLPANAASEPLILFVLATDREVYDRESQPHDWGELTGQFTKKVGMTDRDLEDALSWENLAGISAVLLARGELEAFTPQFGAAAAEGIPVAASSLGDPDAYAELMALVDRGELDKDQTALAPPKEEDIAISLDYWIQGTRLSASIDRHGDTWVEALRNVSSPAGSRALGRRAFGPWWPICCISQLIICHNIRSSGYLGCRLCYRCESCAARCFSGGSNPCHSCGACGGECIYPFLPGTGGSSCRFRPDVMGTPQQCGGSSY